MNTQQKYLNFIKEVKTIINNSNLHTSKKEEIVQTLDEYKRDITNPDIIVPIIGKFSSGKSSLINRFLGNKTLPEGTRPVTRLATELRYTDGASYAEIIALSENGNVAFSKKIDLEELASFADENKSNNNDDFDRYSFIKLFINNEQIKKVEPFVLVDMPGFSSGNKNHNKAIALYIQRGAFFIVLNELASGTLDSENIKEIKKIPATKKFAFCLTKVDARPSVNLNKVKDNLVDLLDEKFEYDKEIYTSSKNDSDVLNQILDDINYEEIISELYGDGLKSIQVRIDETINSNIKVIANGKDWVEMTQQNLEKQKAQIKADQERELNDLELNKFDGEEIIEEVKRELLSRKSSLLSILDSNQTQFQNEIIQISQDKVGELTQSYLKRKSNELTESIANSMRNMIAGTKDFEMNSEIIRRIQNDIKEEINKTMINPVSTSTFVEDKTTNYLTGLLLKVASQFLTNNPIGKAITYFLPDLLSGIFDSSSDREFQVKVQREQQRAAQEGAFSQIVDSIGLELKSQLNDMLINFKRQLIDAIGKEFNSELNKQIQDLELAQEQKNNLQNIELEINKLEQMKTQLDAIVKQYLL